MERVVGQGADIWQGFQESSALAWLWPYAREQLHDLAHRMRIDLPMLPILSRGAMPSFSSESLESREGQESGILEPEQE